MQIQDITFYMTSMLFFFLMTETKHFFIMNFDFFDFLVNKNQKRALNLIVHLFYEEQTYYSFS